MRKLSEEILLHSYKLARQIETIDQHFIYLLEEEIRRRGLSV
ncbi:sporulation histidine kinase inhibitor Sda [Pseudogracilibacillus auburnensis]|nr:sporulation histidine kinase inhibitor Sda [Pseudogracilibacillus auburnensis]MBO1005901.1 sporulation histidine kinase inhibitor Sda [Pseudogracilibacillus auburnensis]